MIHIRFAKDLVDVGRTLTLIFVRCLFTCLDMICFELCEFWEGRGPHCVCGMRQRQHMHGPRQLEVSKSHLRCDISVAFAARQAMHSKKHIVGKSMKKLPMKLPMKKQKKLPMKKQKKLPMKKQKKRLCQPVGLADTGPPSTSEVLHV